MSTKQLPSSYDVPYPPDQHQARLVMGDPIAEAYEWIRGYAANLTDQVHNSYDHEEQGHADITVGELLSVADSHQSTSGWGDYIIRGGAFEGEGVEPMFWDKYAILREIPRDQVKYDGGFFSCSC